MRAPEPYLLCAMGAMALCMASCDFRASGSRSAEQDAIAESSFCTATFQDSLVIMDAQADQHLSVDFPAEEDSSLVSQSVLAWLCDEVRSRCYPNFNGEKVDSTLAVEPSGDTFAEDMVNTYGRKGLELMGADIREMAGEGWAGNQYNYLVIELEEQTADYLTLSLAHEVYLGGAHGGYFCAGRTFRRSDGQPFGWRFFQTEKRAELVELLKKELMTYFSDGEDVPLTTDSALFDHLLLFDDPDTPENELEYGLPLPATEPWITREGVQFIYQQYEIAAYAAGLPSVTLAPAALRDCLTSEGRRFLGLK